MSTPAGFPTFPEWPWFILAVYISSIVINTITRRVPAAAQLQAGF